MKKRREATDVIWRNAPTKRTTSIQHCQKKKRRKTSSRSSRQKSNVKIFTLYNRVRSLSGLSTDSKSPLRMAARNLGSMKSVEKVRRCRCLTFRWYCVHTRERNTKTHSYFFFIRLSSFASQGTQLIGHRRPLPSLIEHVPRCLRSLNMLLTAYAYPNIVPCSIVFSPMDIIRASEIRSCPALDTGKDPSNFWRPGSCYCQNESDFICWWSLKTNSKYFKYLLLGKGYALLESYALSGKMRHPLWRNVWKDMPGTSLKPTKLLPTHFQECKRNELNTSIPSSTDGRRWGWWPSSTDESYYLHLDSNWFRIYKYQTWLERYVV